MKTPLILILGLSLLSCSSSKKQPPSDETVTTSGTPSAPTPAAMARDRRTVPPMQPPSNMATLPLKKVPPAPMVAMSPAAMPPPGILAALPDKSAPKTTPGKKKRGKVREHSVTLLSPGVTPRAPLRYRFRPEGTILKTRLEVEMSMSMVMGTRKSPVSKAPTTVMDLTITNGKRSPRGGLNYTLVVENVRATGRPATISEKNFAELQKQVAVLSGLKGEGTISSRGESSGLRFRFPKGITPQMKTQMAQLSTQMERLAIPLPSEKVGVGARWRAVRTILSQGIPVRTTFEYTLTKRQGDRISLAIKSSQIARNARIDNPQLPPGVTQKVTLLTGTGTGALALDLTLPVPDSRGSTHLEMFTLLTSGSTPKGFVMNLFMDLTVRLMHLKGK